MTGSRYNKPAGGTWHISRKKHTPSFAEGNSAKLLSGVFFEQNFFEPGQFFTKNASDLHRSARSTPSAQHQAVAF